MSEKHGVFISHIVQESAVAKVLQRHLEQAYGPDFPVFVSSDQKSIGGGRKWFEHIIRNLQEARVVLVLISQEGAKREWVNFETGFGDGAGATVIPIATMQLNFSRLGFPMAGFNGRVIDDIEGILHDITRETKVVANTVDTLQYREDVHAAEASVTYKSIAVTPRVIVTSGGRRELRFTLRNNGNVDLDLLMLEAWVPYSILIKAGWPKEEAPNSLRYLSITRDEETYMYASFTTVPAVRFDSLRPVLTPSMGEIELFNPSFVLGDVSEEQLDLNIYYHIHARNYSTSQEAIQLREVKGI